VSAGESNRRAHRESGLIRLGVAVGGPFDEAVPKVAQGAWMPTGIYEHHGPRPPSRLTFEELVGFMPVRLDVHTQHDTA
jgi:hypothetical protein